MNVTGDKKNSDSSAQTPLDLRAGAATAARSSSGSGGGSGNLSLLTTATATNDNNQGTSSSNSNNAATCNDCRQLRREVEGLHKKVNGLVYLLCNQAGGVEAAASSSNSQPNASSSNLSGSRKRPATPPATKSATLPPSVVHHPIPVIPTSTPLSPQMSAPLTHSVPFNFPECPVALRPLSACGFAPFLHYGWPLPLLPTTYTTVASPTMPLTIAEQVNVFQSSVNSNDGGRRRWSSPSSVESSNGGPKTSDSNESATRIDPVSNDSASSSSDPIIMISPNAAPVAVPATQTPAAMPIMERKRPITDDYTKILKEKEHLKKNLHEIKIPVPEAIQADPGFRPLSEAQIVTQLVQNKKWEELEAREAMTQLCKKLAEKRVFGPKLMANTTVAGPNHSTYNNLPCEGIIYIQDVCRRIVGPKLRSIDDFDDAFREATKKLAARCRRVRHAKKSKSLLDGSVISLRDSSTDSL